MCAGRARTCDGHDPSGLATFFNETETVTRGQRTDRPEDEHKVMEPRTGEETQRATRTLVASWAEKEAAGVGGGWRAQWSV